MEKSLGKTVIVLSLVLVLILVQPLTVNAEKTKVVECMGGTVFEDGTTVFTSVFLSPNLKTIKPDKTFENTVLVMLVAQKFDPKIVSKISREIFGGKGQGGLQIPTLTQTKIQPENLYHGIPKTMLITIQKQSPKTNEKIKNILLRLSKYYGVNFRSLISLKQKLFSAEIFFAAYTTDKDYRFFEGKLMESLKGLDNGFAPSVYEAYLNGVFTPKLKDWSSDGTLIVSGIINYPLLKRVLGIQAMMLPQSIPKDVTTKLLKFLEASGLTPFFIQLSLWENLYHSSPQTHTFSIQKLLHLKKPISASKHSSLSVVFLSTPTKATTTTGLEGWEIKGSTAIKTLKAGEVLKEGKLTFNYIFPPNISVKKLVDKTVVDEDSTVKVKVEILNKDTKPIYNITIDDSQTLKTYPTSLTVVEGSPTKKLEKIKAGEKITYTYIIKLKNLGYYTLPPAKITYTCEQKDYSTTTNQAYIKVKKPTIQKIILKEYKLITSYGEKTLNKFVPGYGWIITNLIILAILTIIAYSIYKSFKKPRKTTTQQPTQKTQT